MVIGDFLCEGVPVFSEKWFTAHEADLLWVDGGEIVDEVECFSGGEFVRSWFSCG